MTLDGEAAVVIDGTERARLSRGDFFGEVVLIGEPPTADVLATAPLRCLGPRHGVPSRSVRHERGRS